jgi:hypothetical protein
VLSRLIKEGWPRFLASVKDTERYFQRLRIQPWTGHQSIEGLGARWNPCGPPCTYNRNNVRHGVGEGGMETIKRRGTGDLL